MVTIEKLQILFLFTIFGQKSYSYKVRCPKQSEWKYMAEATCGNLLGYFCLKNRNIHIYVEFCKQNPDMIRDITWKEGHKSVVRGNLDGEVCAIERYQPFKFKTNGNSDCVYSKSLCKDEGQIIYHNGSTTVDTHCRCDHTKGFALLSKTKQTCFCIPSTEDCSCYKKECKRNYKLSPDYSCTPIDNLDDQVACNGHHKRALINVDSQLPKLKQPKRTDFSPERTFYIKNGIDWYCLKLTGVLMVAIGCIIFLFIYGFATRVEVQTFEEMARQKINECLDIELRVVVIGKVGVGKSAICNMIIEKNEFESRNCMAAVTKETQSKRVDFHGQHILLIDTPGVFGNKSNKEKVEGEIKRCIKIGSPGLHAILFVMRLGRLSDEDSYTIKTFLEYFGKSDLEARVILVFTHVNSVDLDNFNLNDHLSEAPKELKELMDRSGDRVEVLNIDIALDKRIKFDQVTNLLKKIKKLELEKLMTYFTDSLFCETEKQLRLAEDKIINEQNKKIFEDKYDFFKTVRWKATQDIL